MTDCGGRLENDRHHPRARREQTNPAQEHAAHRRHVAGRVERARVPARRVRHVRLDGRHRDRERSAQVRRARDRPPCRARDGHEHERGRDASRAWRDRRLARRRRRHGAVHLAVHDGGRVAEGCCRRSLRANRVRLPQARRVPLGRVSRRGQVGGCEPRPERAAHGRANVRAADGRDWCLLREDGQLVAGRRRAVLLLPPVARRGLSSCGHRHAGGL